MQLRKPISLLLAVLLVSAAASAASFQSKPANVTGKYKGVAKSDQLGDIPITVEIKDEAGKLSGKIDTPQGASTINNGTYADGKVTLKFDAGGNEGTVTATVDGDKITGKWELAGMGGPLELTKSAGDAAPSTPAGSAPAGASSAGDPLSGEWEGSADAGGQQIPFTLKLKLEGEKVTGTSETAQGAIPLTDGKFSAGKLSFAIDTGQGLIKLNGMVKEGKIDGEFDFAGQMNGKWAAKKK
jgi:major membrane immunogen (membrane-anchored lipoprotein)